MMQSVSPCRRNSENIGVTTTLQHSEATKEDKSDLFNHIDKLAAGHDVTVSSTMIKITYNKGVKDHSLTSLCRNDLENKHSITFNSSLKSNHNQNFPTEIKNHRKSCDDILFMDRNMDVRNDSKTNQKKKLNNTIKGSYPTLLEVDKNHTIKEKKYISKNHSKVANSTFNNHIQNLANFNKKFPELKVLIHKMDTSEPSLSPNLPTPVKLVVDKHSIQKTTSDINDKSVCKNDSCKNSDESFGVGGIPKLQIKKDKVKVVGSQNLENERLKSVKNKDENFKKKRHLSEESGNHQSKKLKSDTNISDDVVNDKVKENVTKVKKKVNINHKEKKTRIKMESVEEMLKDCGKRDLLWEDPNLPPGWRRIIKGKHIGNVLKPVVCIASPEGRKFYFRARLKNYLEKTKSQLTVDDFHFGLYEKRPKDDDDLEKSTNTSELTGKSRAEKNLLLVDPDLPPGWNRKVRVKNDMEGTDKFQVILISPEGRKFKRKHLLQQHLLKTQSPLDIKQFHFGLYPRKKGVKIPSPSGTNKVKSLSKINSFGSKKKEGKKSIGDRHADKHAKVNGGPKGGSSSGLTKWKRSSVILTKVDSGFTLHGEQPLLVDPNLPPGWRRYIKVLPVRENSGRMEVTIVSPDGRRHKSKESLAEYIKQKGLNFKVDDFDFSIFGRSSKKFSETSTVTVPLPKKQEGHQTTNRDSSYLNSSSLLPLFDYENSLNDESLNTRESSMINYVGGIMLHCGLRDLRTERRVRNSSGEQEKILKKFLDSEKAKATNGENEISNNWVQTLIHCRSDFGSVDVDAVSTIANLTMKFLQGLTRHAMKASKNESKLEYEDIAEVIDKYESLSPLKTLIPKKITFREFIRSNRPKKYSSFT